MKGCTKCGEQKPLDAFHRVWKDRDVLRSACIDCERQAAREWRAKNRERHNERTRRWRGENAEAWAEYMRAWRAANPDYQRDWAQANAESRKAGGRRLRAVDPDRYREYARQHRVRKMALPCEDIDQRAVFARDKGVCGICGEPVDPQQWDLDHIQPLSKGGHHLYENVQVSHPTCNKRKGAKWPIPCGSQRA